MTHRHDSSDAPASGFRGLGRSEVTDLGELVPVDEHRERILASLTPLEPIELGLNDVLGLVLAEDVVADRSLPPFANSAMDGYAVVAADTGGASADRPAELEVTGEVAAAAGTPPVLARGTALRIMTGAPIPEGADAVVPVEVTRSAGRQVEVLRPASPGDHVRPAGEDVAAGQRLLRAGRRLRPADIGVLASLGRSRVRCHPRPRVVVLSTGSELVRADQPLAFGQIPDSNGPMLAALVRQADAVPFWAGIVVDDRRALLDAFDSNLGHADLIITTGGVSAGTRDHVRDVLHMLSDDVAHTKVAMKPGMPQVFGTIRGVPVFGLPGNPVSSFVSFEVFVRPAIRTLQGRRDAVRPRVSATLTDDVDTPAGKRTYVRVRVRQEGGRWTARLAGGQGSHQLSALVQTDGLAIVDEDRTRVQAGETVPVMLLVET